MVPRLGRNYYTLLSAQLVSRFGDALDTVALAWLAYQLTGSAVLLGALLAVNALPNLLFAPLAGVWVDRHRKQPLIVACHWGRGTTVVLLAVLFLVGWLPVWGLFVLTFVNSTFETFATPASSALAVHLVDRDKLVEAGGLTTSLTTLVQMVGLGVAGAVIGFIGVGGAILVDGATFVFAAVVTRLPRIPGDVPRPGALTPQLWWQDFREGVEFVAGNRTLLVVVGLALFANFAFAPLNVLEAPYVKEVLGGGPEVLSWLGLGLTAGMVVGGLAVAAVERRWGTWPTVLGAFVGVGAACGLVGLPGLMDGGTVGIPVAVGAYALAGLFLPWATTPLGAWMSARVPPEQQGRVFSAFNALCLAAVPLGAALAGASAGVVSVPALFAVNGALVVAVTLAVGAWFRVSCDHGRGNEATG